MPSVFPSIQSGGGQFGLISISPAMRLVGEMGVEVLRTELSGFGLERILLLVEFGFLSQPN